MLIRLVKMYTPNMGYGVLGRFNPEVEKVCKQINEEIASEKSKPQPDKDRISRLMQELMIRGLSLNTGYVWHF